MPVDVMSLLRARRAAALEERGLERRIERLREIICSTTASAEDSLRSGFAGDRMAEHAARTDALERELSALRKRVSAEFGYLHNRLERLSPPQRRLLRLRYCKGRSWRQVARAMRFSESYVYFLHRRALAALEACLE